MTSRKNKRCLGLDGVLSLWESDLLLLLLLSGSGSLELGQSSSQGSGLLGSQVLWLVLLTLVQLSDSLSLLLVDDSQDTGNVLSDSVDSWKRWLGQLGNLKLSKLLLQVKKLRLQLLLRLGSQFVRLNTGLYEIMRGCKCALVIMCAWIRVSLFAVQKVYNLT